MVVRYDTTARGGIDKMKHALIDVPNGTKIELGEIAEIKSVSSPNTINRENVQRKVVVSANVNGRDLRGAVNAIRESVQAIVDLPDGYRMVFNL